MRSAQREWMNRLVVTVSLGALAFPLAACLAAGPASSSEDVGVEDAALEGDGDASVVRQDGAATGDDGAAPSRTDAAGTDAWSADDAGSRDVRDHRVVTMFALNTQEFTHRAEGRETLRRVIALHEETGVPLDVYLTDTVVASLEDEDPALLAVVLGSPVVTLGYHTRPPRPYRTGYDWTGELAGWAETDPGRLRALVRDYETHLVDLELGTPTARAGGYAHLAELAGAPPLVVGAAGDGPIQREQWTVFSEMGASFFVNHAGEGRVTNFGDRLNGLSLRPEHVDLILISVFEPAHAAGGCPQTWGAAPESILDDAIAHACDAAGSTPPCVVGVKMHDNDFFACDSAWATVYLARGVLAAGPPFPVDRASVLLDATEQARRWEFYEGTVRHAASLTATPPVSIADFARAR